MNICCCALCVNAHSVSQWGDGLPAAVESQQVFTELTYFCLIVSTPTTPIEIMFLQLWVHLLMYVPHSQAYL